MNDCNLLILNIDKVHTTSLGIKRIKNNINIDDEDIFLYLKNKIMSDSCNIYMKGKNYYCEVDGIRITINSYNYCIITAHIMR